MISRHRFKYTGSANFNLDNIEIPENGVALFDSLSGVGGIDWMPYDGATVTVYSGPRVSSRVVRNFNDTLNNSIYYLVTDTVYTEDDRNTILSLATEVPLTELTVDGQKRYVGTFVFNNPNDYEYLYLIWDMRDSLDIGSVSYTDKPATRYIDVDFGSNVGVAGINYAATTEPCRFVLEYAGNIVADTGYVGVNSVANYNALISTGVSEENIKLRTPLDGLVDNGTGSITFKKYSSLSSARLIVDGPIGTTVAWSASKVNPVLTSFYLDTTDGTLSNVCSQTPNDQKWHDGSSALPTYGDRIYDNSSGSTVYDGGNAYHVMNPTSLGAPPVSGGTYVGVRTDGVVTAVGGCDCDDLVAPTVDQDDLDFVVDKPVDIILSATDNPTSWSIDGSCEIFELTGGTKGSIYSVTFCDTTTKNVSVNTGGTIRVSATAATLSFGDGSATSIGIDNSFYLPDGLTLNEETGQLSGIPTEPCSYSVDLIATNCFGSSSPTTVTITVATGIQLTPFAMDVENVSTGGAAACLITPTYSMMYHDGIGDTPALGDTIYIDYKGTEKLMGGSRWYNVDGSAISIKVCETGKVCDTHTC